jgi:hypothetical protein
VGNFNAGGGGFAIFSFGGVTVTFGIGVAIFSFGGVTPLFVAPLLGLSTLGLPTVVVPFPTLSALGFPTPTVGPLAGATVVVVAPLCPVPSGGVKPD